MKEKNTGVLRLVLRVLQGMLIGVGAVLPGISGGVLCVVFGIYKPIMELLSSPIKKCKTHVPRLLPVIVGAVLGFLGVAKVLAFFLERYPDQSVCLFVGLIAGMLPSLFREAGEQGRTRGSWISLVAAFAVVLALLLSLNVLSVTIAPSFGWYLFCGFCMALSIIAPGMSFSTLLMPLGLYTPLVDGIGGSVAVGEDQPPLGIVFPPYFFQRGVPVHRIESGGGVGIHIPWAGAEFPAQIHADEGG